MELSDQIIQVLEYLAEKMGVTIDWSQQNVMPYMQQICEKYIRYEIATSIMWMLTGLAFIASAVWWIRACKICMKKYEDAMWHSEWNMAAWSCVAALAICAVIGIVIVLSQVHDIMRCILFPEAQIYSYIKALMEWGEP